MIHLAHVTKTYPGTPGCPEFPVLQDACMDVSPREFVAVCGHSGSGKTTLLNILGALDSDYTGTVTIAGCSTRGLSDRELSAFRRNTVGFVFQQFNLLPHLTALDNVLMPCWFLGSGSSGSAPKAALRERGLHLLETAGLQGKADRFPSQLSGGERQRVAIARSLILSPRVLLCDEPTGNLDPDTSDAIIAIFRKLSGDGGLTVVVVTHDERVSRAADRILTLNNGQIFPPNSSHQMQPAPA